MPNFRFIQKQKNGSFLVSEKKLKTNQIITLQKRLFLVKAALIFATQTKLHKLSQLNWFVQLSMFVRLYKIGLLRCCAYALEMLDI